MWSLKVSGRKNPIEVKKANIKLHEKEASIYDKLHHEIFNVFEQRAIEERFSSAIANVKQKGRCLDLGCGTGNLIAREIRNFDFVIGLDISSEMLNMCKANFPDVALVRGDCENLPFKHNAFDFVSMFSTLHHLSSLRKALEEIQRILKKTGAIYIDHEDNFVNPRLPFFSLRSHTSH